VVIGFATKNLEAAVAIWTGSGLSTELLTDQFRSGGVSTSIGANGTIYAAWRGLDASGANSGVYYAQRQATNSWATVHLGEGDVKNLVTIVADSGGSLHLGWNAMTSGTPRFYYALRQAGSSQFSTAVPASRLSVYNAHLAVSSGGAFAHAALEDGSGGPTSITYARFSGGVSGPSATPQIANNAAIIKQSSSVSVGFLNVNDSPTQIRWRWGSQPTDASTDSGGWQSFTSPMTISVPTSVTSSATCAAVRLYTQVRNASQVAGNVQSDDVIIDTGVTAAVTLSNPHTLQKSPQFSDLSASLGDFAQDGGASDGHPGYTRDPVMYVGVQGTSECSGIDELATGRSDTMIAPAVKVLKDSFTSVLPLPGAFQSGSNSVLLQVSDKVGNWKNYKSTLIFDMIAPVLDANSPGTISAVPNAKATILTSLKFSNINVTDNLYPGRGFWGVWVANSRSTVTNPATNSSLVWYPLAAPGTGTSFTLTNWSLASGLKGKDITVGSYFVYVRFLDGAGNPTATVMPPIQLNLTQVTFPSLALPLIRR